MALEMLIMYEKSCSKQIGDLTEGFPGRIRNLSETEPWDGIIQILLAVRVKLN
jgi:hypothetical protein